MNELQKGYVAGFLDADGSIYISQTAEGYFGPRVALTNSDLPTLEAIHEWIGGYLRSRERKSKAKTKHCIEFSSKCSILELLIPISPYLIRKYEQSQLMIDWCLNEHTREERVNIAARMKELNHK